MQQDGLEGVIGRRLRVRAESLKGAHVVQEFAARSAVIDRGVLGEHTDPALELLLGGAVDMDVFDRVTLRADGRFFPDLTDPSQLRATASAKCSVHLDEMKAWAVGLEVKYQYQSRVNPGTPDDLFVLAGTLDYSF